jgi:acetyltransferase-like isoleucine patch superfamily enzyme
MKNLFIYLAKKIIKRPDLAFSEKIPMGCYLRIAIQRILMLIRGHFKGVFWGKHGNRLYIGKKTEFICAKNIIAGNGVSIQDQVIINALSVDGIVLGNNCSIGMRTAIKASGSLVEVGKGFVLGDYSTIANDCFVGAAGGVVIGSYVAVGQNVRFHSENHNFASLGKKICEQGTSHKGIKIGSDCWIGAGAVFLDGAEIGDGCVVGANAVVTKPFPKNAVIAGVPAKIVRMRT